MKPVSLIMMALLGCAWMHTGAQSGSDGLIFQPLSSGKALPGTQPDNHASTVVELKSGDVMAAWFAGSKEGHPDVAIYGARLHDGAWSAPAELARADKVPCWNPVLFHTSDGRLWLYYKFGPRPSSWAGARKWSTDEGRTWSQEERLPEGILGPIKDKPLVLGDGVIVSGSSVEGHGWAAWIERSTDDGKTWSNSAERSGKRRCASGAEIEAARQQFPGIIYPPRSITVRHYSADGHLAGPTSSPLGRSQTKTTKMLSRSTGAMEKAYGRRHFYRSAKFNSGIDAVKMKDGRSPGTQQ